MKGLIGVPICRGCFECLYLGSLHSSPLKAGFGFRVCFPLCEANLSLTIRVDKAVLSLVVHGS